MQKGFANYILVLIVVAVVAAVAVGALVWRNNSGLLIPGGQKACTLEAKICPDGSGVGRAGPNCEFAACPSLKPSATANSSVNTASWKEYSNSENKLSFKYPPTWNVSSRIDAVEVSGENSRLVFQISPYPSLDFDLLYAKPNGTINQNPVFIRTKIKNLDIEGFKATMYSNESTPANQIKSFNISVYLVKGAPITMVSGNTEPTSKEELLATFDQIISTIKFN